MNTYMLPSGAYSQPNDDEVTPDAVLQGALSVVPGNQSRRDATRRWEKRALP